MARSLFVQAQELDRFFEEAAGDLVLVRRTFAFWQSSRRIHGTVMWGRPSEDDVAAMCQVWDTHLRSPYGADPTLTDIRGLEAVDLLAFERLLRTFGEQGAEWSARAGAQAILHAGGFSGAVILGALQLVGAGYRLGSFDAPGPALAWLGRSELESEYGALRASLLDAPDIVRRVRVTLGEASSPLSTRTLARRLGLSVRSLQRHLAGVGTSVRIERTRFLVSRAERLLEGTELDLDAIAEMLDVGSAARLVSLFQSVHGTTPGAYRAAKAGRAAD